MEGVKEAILADRFCMDTVGIELLEIELGYAKARLTIGPEHLNGLAIVQGGAIFTLADLALAAAANSQGTATVAANANIAFLKAVTGGVLYAEAKEESRHGRLGTYTVRVTNDQNELVALMQGTGYRKRESLATLRSNLQGKESAAPAGRG